MSNLKITEEIVKKKVDAKIRDILIDNIDTISTDKGAYGIYVNGKRATIPGSNKGLWSTHLGARNAIVGRIRHHIINLLRDTYHISDYELTQRYTDTITKLFKDKVIEVRHLTH